VKTVYPPVSLRALGGYNKTLQINVFKNDTNALMCIHTTPQDWSSCMQHVTACIRNDAAHTRKTKIKIKSTLKGEVCCKYHSDGTIV